jgi:nicotinamidase-related amidase
MNGTWGQLRLKELEPQKDIYIRAKDGPMLGIKTYTEEELLKYIQRAKEGKAHLIFEKQSYDVGTNPNFEPTMKMLVTSGVEKLVLNGDATDYCDDAAILRIAEVRDKYNSRLKIYVVTDAIEAVNIDFEGNIDPQFGEKALKRMQDRGAKLITTKDVLEGRLD